MIFIVAAVIMAPGRRRQKKKKDLQQPRRKQNTGLRPEHHRGKFVTALWRDKTEQFVSEEKIEAA